MKVKKIFSLLMGAAVLYSSLPLNGVVIDNLKTNVIDAKAEEETSDHRIVSTFENGKLTVSKGWLCLGCEFDIDFDFSDVTTLYLGNNVALGGASATGGADYSIKFKNLEEFEVSDTNPNYTVQDGVLYNKDMTELIAYPCGKKDETFVIPDTVKSGFGYQENSYIKHLQMGRDYIGCYGRGNLVDDPDLLDYTDLRTNKFLSLEDITVSEYNKFYTSQDGVLFNKKKTYLFIYPENRKDVIYEIPDTVQIVDMYAFVRLGIYSSESSCDEETANPNLETVKIGANVLNIGLERWSGGYEYIYSFEYCSNLKEIIVDENNPNYTSIDGVLYNKDITHLYVCPSKKTLTEIPDTVEKIGGYAGSYDASDIKIIDGFKYRKNYGDDETYKLVSCPKDIESIAFPDTLTITSVNFSGCTNHKEVTLPDTITRIDDETFKGCTSLTSVIIPKTLTYIGWKAFKDCISLKNIVIPDSVTSIDNYAFSGCTSLTNIEIPDSVNSIDWNAFENCTSLTNIVIPSSVTYIRGGAFKGCTNLEDVIILNPQINIASDAFKGTKWLEKIQSDSQLTIVDGILVSGKNCSGDVVIPDTVESIGSSAFLGCKELTSVIIPDSVTSIGESAFSGCINLESIVIPDTITSIGESAFKGCENLESISIPDMVTSIGNCAFYNCKKITSITIPNSVKSMGYYVFYGCTSLKDLTTPYLEESMEFSGCTSLKNIIISNSATSMKFSNCKSVTDLKIPDSVTSIYISNFTSLKNIELPDSVTSIIFSDCTSLTDINIPESVTSVSFSDCTSLKEINIPNSVTSVDFSGCTSLESVVIPDSITSIGWRDFENCKSLSSVVIPDSVTSINDSAFSGCTSLTDITIPDSVTSIGSDAFEGTPWLENQQKENPLVFVNGILVDGKKCKGSVSIPNTIKTISDNAFKDNTDITDLKITPYSNLTIGSYAFSGCTNLSSVIMDDSEFYPCVSIGSYAFKNCTNLKTAELSIPYMDCYINNSAFSGCTSLTDIEFPRTDNGIEDNMFSGCTNLKSIKLPDNLYSIGYNVFSGTKIKEIDIPSSVHNISWSAFKDSSIQRINFGGTEEEWKKMDSDGSLSKNIMVIFRPESKTEFKHQDDTGMTIEVGKITLNSSYTRNYVYVPVKVFNNTGFAATALKYTYDKKLSQNGWSSGLVSSESSTINNSLYLTSARSTNITEDGELYGISFKLPDNISDGDVYDISLENCGIYDADGNVLDVKTYSGSITIDDETVEEDPSITYGDVNSDGEVDIADAVILNKYLINCAALSEVQIKSADCLLDGRINASDTIAIMSLLVHNCNSLPIKP